MFTEVGRGQKEPDVRILSLSYSSPQRFSLPYFLHSSPDAGGKHRTEKAGERNIAVRDPETQGGSSSGE